MKLKKPSAGFTLIELLIVVVIMGTLAAIAVNEYGGVKQAARDAKRKADINQVKSAMIEFRSEGTTYPSDTSYSNLNLSGRLVPKYIDALPQDPKNSDPYVYTYHPAGIGTCSGPQLGIHLESADDPVYNTRTCGQAAGSYYVPLPEQ